MTLNFTNIDIMFRSCMYTLSSMLLSFPYFKIFFTKISKFQILLFFLFQADRPTGTVDRRQCQDVHVCARLSVDRPGRPTESSCSRVFWVDRPVDRKKEAVFCLLGRSTRANGSLPAELAVDRPGRPPGLQQPNGSFLFCAILKSVFQTAFWHTFSGFFRSFSEQIRSK